MAPRLLIGMQFNRHFFVELSGFHLIIRRQDPSANFQTRKNRPFFPVENTPAFTHP